MSISTTTTRILVCEHSATYARALTRFLEHQGGIKVIGICATGEEALRSVSRLAPDLVTMDLQLSGMSGLRTIEAMMRLHAVPIVVISVDSARRSDNAAAVLAAGVLEALDKTHVRLDEPTEPSAIALRHRLRRLARASVRPERDGSVGTQGLAPPLRAAGAIGICSSTGGPQALATILAELPGDFPVPVLIAQHMSTGFIDGLVRWLDQLVPLPVAVARSGIGGSGVWVAPDDADLMLEPSMRLSLDNESLAGPHRPSGDVLLSSMARALGPRALGVVLTGMGRDGAKGVTAIIRGGGRVIAQSEDTSVVFGMPKAAIERGATPVLALGSIAGALRRASPGSGEE